MKYQSISCSLYDRIETLAVSRKKVKILFIEEEKAVESIIGTINNVFSENNAEYLSINDINIRLDKIKSISEI